MKQLNNTYNNQGNQKNQMNQGSNNVPKLRFPEFKDNWEKKKLGEVAVINPSNKKLPDEFIYIDLESVENGELLKENLILKSEAPSRAQRLLEKGDILFQMVRPYQMNNLYFNRTGNYVASTGYAQIRTKNSEGFLYQHLHYQKFAGKVIEKCTGTSYPAINSTDLSNIEVCFPELKEQTKIATFLTAVDEKRQALKKKKSLLEEYKKGVMQKLFSQQLRFKDENGKGFPVWEEKKLGEMGTFFSGGTPLTTKRQYFNGNIPFIRSGELNADSTEQYISEEGLKNSSAKMVEIGDLIYALYGATSGEVAISKIKGAINQAILCIRTNLDNTFLLNYLILNKENILKTYLQGGQGNLSAEIIKSLIVPVPKLNEQVKISNFLSAINSKVKAVDFELIQIENWKNGLLQKMFC